MGHVGRVGDRHGGGHGSSDIEQVIALPAHEHGHGLDREQTGGRGQLPAAVVPAVVRPGP